MAVRDLSAGGRHLAIRRPSGEARIVSFGQKGDVPVPGDYDGDGRTDVAVFRPATATWYALLSSAGPGTAGANSEQEGDLPVPRDYDGDGKDDLAVSGRRPGSGISPAVFPPSVVRSFHSARRGTGRCPPISTGTASSIRLSFAPPKGPGTSGSLPALHWRTVSFGLPGDTVLAERFGGKRTPELAAFRPSTGTLFLLDTVSEKGASFVFGQRGDLPLGAILPSGRSD